MAPIYNFNPGPSILPQEVYQKTAHAILNYNDTGLSLLELGHRSKEFQPIIEGADRDLRDLLKIPSDYAILFLGGGASLQFSMVPMNLLPEGSVADYTDTGTWAAKALKEAKLYGNVNVACTSKETTYNAIPKNLKLTPGSRYLHITSNNTIYGTQWKEFPKYDGLMVADMSSDILSRPIDVTQFGLIFAGAQKNMGPAGVCVVIVRKDLAGKSGRKLPAMLDYEQHIKENSLYNTPPVFAVYVVAETLKWLKGKGGVEGIQKINERKAGKLYQAIDESNMYKGTVVKEDRSLMNVCFVIGNEEKEKKFLVEAKEQGLVCLAGHRSVGGFRASIYNAMPEEGVDALIAFMKAFEKKNG
ncbi:MAG: phosphoserine transaminase [Elusimicrobia bacterium RIFOXYB2_FULL_49_7]|nr:MAG: phosphoserine transaminase [Elusimicrobia bacterium RIFOXYB2_FULL_49_7]